MCVYIYIYVTIMSKQMELNKYQRDPVRNKAHPALQQLALEDLETARTRLSSEPGLRLQACEVIEYFS